VKEREKEGHWRIVRLRKQHWVAINWMDSRFLTQKCNVMRSERQIRGEASSWTCCRSSRYRRPVQIWLLSPEEPQYSQGQITGGALGLTCGQSSPCSCWIQLNSIHPFFVQQVMQSPWTNPFRHLILNLWPTKARHKIS
jgi:hypothetical protein